MVVSVVSVETSNFALFNALLIHRGKGDWIGLGEGCLAIAGFLKFVVLRVVTFQALGNSV